MLKQQLDPECLDFGKEEYASGNMIRKEVRIKEGIDKETARKINNRIKEMKLKVQGSIMEDQVRVQGKKIDDLQAVIARLRAENFGQPLQFVNMR